MHDSDPAQICHEIPANSPPPYPQGDCQLPPRYVIHVDEPTEEPPAYNYYDVESGSFLDRALAQYAQSISPTATSSAFRYSLVRDQDEEATSRAASALRPRLREIFIYCAAIFCGAVWALVWICAIGYAVVLAVQKLTGNLV